MIVALALVGAVAWSAAASLGALCGCRWPAALSCEGWRAVRVWRAAKREVWSFLTSTCALAIWHSLAVLVRFSSVEDVDYPGAPAASQQTFPMAPETLTRRWPRRRVQVAHAHLRARDLRPRRLAADALRGLVVLPHAAHGDAPAPLPRPRRRARVALLARSRREAARLPAARRAPHHVPRDGLLRALRVLPPGRRRVPHGRRARLPDVGDGARALPRAGLHHPGVVQAVPGLPGLRHPVLPHLRSWPAGPLLRRAPPRAGPPAARDVRQLRRLRGAQRHPAADAPRPALPQGRLVRRAALHGRAHVAERLPARLPARRAAHAARALLRHLAALRAGHRRRRALPVAGGEHGRAHVVVLRHVDVLHGALLHAEDAQARAAPHRVRRARRGPGLRAGPGGAPLRLREADPDALRAHPAAPSAYIKSSRRVSPSTCTQLTD